MEREAVNSQMELHSEYALHLVLAKLNDLGKGLCILPWLPFLLSTFSAARSLGSLCCWDF